MLPILLNFILLQIILIVFTTLDGLGHLYLVQPTRRPLYVRVSTSAPFWLLSHLYKLVAAPRKYLGFDLM